MNTTGDKSLKKKAQDRNAAFHSTDRAYKTPFWNGVHEKEERMYEEECTKKEAISILISTAHELLRGLRSGEIALKDLHFLMSSFTNATFIYGTDLYDIYDGELYGMIEFLDNNDAVDKMEQELRNLEVLIGDTK